MKRIRKLLTGSLLMLALTTSAADYTVTSNTITIPVKSPTATGARLVRLEVVNSKIIRVEATAATSFPQKTSLIILPQPNYNNFKVSETGSSVAVATPDVKAVVDAVTGHVCFFDRNGKTLLDEVGGGKGKEFKPYTVPQREIGADSRLTDDQRHGWTWTATFESPDDEAFFGLGQHQSDELNMKGRNEDLFQYNTKISVPFVLSNKNYGVLWDSYSYCRFGNPNDYLQLNRAFKLYDKDGNPGALTGTYTDRDGNTVTRAEDSIYYEFALPDIPARGLTDVGVANLPKGFKLNGAHVTYEGFIEAPEANLYHFLLYYAGYTRVFIDGEEVVPERWRTAWNPNSHKFEYALDKGMRHHLLIDWYPDGDVSYCGLRVATPRSQAEQNRLCIWSEMAKDMDYYFIAGDNLDQVISGYRTLTGKAQVMPRWTLGFWQSRERYKSSEEIESTLKHFRDKHIPVDNIVQDWNYWKLDSWGSHQFEKSRYPNPQAMLDSVHSMHGRFMISVWPKFYCSTDNYKALDANGWIYHQAVKDSIYDWLGFMGSFYDAYSAGARKMFWKQMDDNLYSKYHYGIDAWWMDASEPNVRDCTPMWYRKALCGATDLGSATEYFNAYSIVNADAIYNGQRSVNPNQRVFLLTRSGFAGEQRYSTASWSGDIGTRWEDMRAQLTAGLNYSMSGIPFWGMDIGGFCVENRYVKAQQEYDNTGKENADLKEWRELQARWNEFGAFVPLYRTHGQWPLREVWNIAPEDHPAYKAIVYYDKLRYRLMPYLYSMAGAVHFDDYTPMRALVMDFNGDSKVYDIKDQFMFGPALMACPVMKYGERHRSVYLPQQKGWYDLYTNKYYGGGQTIDVDAPYDRIPVFVPEGSILLFGPEMEWSDEKPADPITVYVYAGKDGSFTLYEDENTNYNYEKGLYSTITFKYDDASHSLTIGQRKGHFSGMLKNRKFNIVLRTPQTVDATLNPDSAKGKTVEYKGKKLVVKL